LGKYVHIQTELPGPKSKEVLERKGQAVPRALAALAPFVVAKAEGWWRTSTETGSSISPAAGAC